MRLTRSRTISAYGSGSPDGIPGSSQAGREPGARVAPVSTDTTTSQRGVVVSESRLPRRSRRPSDLARLVGSLLLLAVPLVLGTLAVSTSTGLEQDLLRSFDAIQGLTKLVLRL